MPNGSATRLRRSQGKILIAAEEVFLQHGFRDATMDAVAEKAGVSKQTVYAHFMSKEALFIRVVEAMCGKASTDIGEDQDVFVVDQPAKDYLVDLAIQQLTAVLTPRLMRLRRMVIGEVDRFPDLGRTLYTYGPMRSIKRLEKAFAHYAAKGELKLPDPQGAASQFNWMLMGAPISTAMLLRDEGIPSQDQVRRHATESVRMFLCAYAPGQPVA